MSVAVIVDQVVQPSAGNSAPILGIPSDAGIALIGTGSAQLQVTFDIHSVVTAGTATWFNQGSAATSNTKVGQLGFVASGVRVVVTSGSWTLQVAQDNL